MKLDEIQPNLLAILVAMPVFAAAQAAQHTWNENSGVQQFTGVIFADDGQKVQVMEASLESEGLSILVMTPQCIHVESQGQGAVSLVYSSTIWVRTNPKVTANGAAKWNPLTLEKAIIPAVLAFGSAPVNYFQIPGNLEPETDFTDLGCNSRLIRFSTKVIL